MLYKKYGFRCHHSYIYYIWKSYLFSLYKKLLKILIQINLDVLEFTWYFCVTQLNKVDFHELKYFFGACFLFVREKDK